MIFHARLAFDYFEEFQENWHEQWWGQIAVGTPYWWSYETNPVGIS